MLGFRSFRSKTDSSSSSSRMLGCDQRCRDHPGWQQRTRDHPGVRTSAAQFDFSGVTDLTGCEPYTSSRSLSGYEVIASQGAPWTDLLISLCKTL